jgi:hypothetical protein
VRSEQRARRDAEIFLAAPAAEAGRALEAPPGRGIPFSPNDIHSTMRGDTRLFIWGWVEYDDIFEGSRRHRTEYCNELLTDGFEVPIERREITSRVYGRHNGYDDHCYRSLQTPKV